MKRKNLLRPSKHVHSKKMNVTPSREEPKIADKLSKKIRLSEDILASTPIIMGYGKHRFCVENYRNIIEYTDELIRIQTKTGKIYLLGKNLVIAYYRDDGMCVIGDISSIEYH